MTWLSMEDKALRHLSSHFSPNDWTWDDFSPTPLPIWGEALSNVAPISSLGMGVTNHYSGNPCMLYFTDCTERKLTAEDLTIMTSAVQSLATAISMVYELYIIEFLDDDGNEFHMHCRIIHPA